MSPDSSETLPVRPLRLGIAGQYLGRARYGAALAALPTLQVIGIADADSRAARAWARELPGRPPVFADLLALLAALPDLDALLMSMPLPERAGGIKTALHAGKPVLCDFPFADSLSVTDRLITLAAQEQTLLMPTMPHRFDPYFQEASRMVAMGRMGALRQVRCEWNFPLGGSFALENGVVPEDSDWYDLLQAIACQTIDVCCWWLGAPLSVNADIDLPAYTRLAGRRASAPVANLIVTHERGQATHLLSRSRSVQPGERYLLTGDADSLELLVSAGEAASVVAPSLKLRPLDRRPESVLPTNHNQPLPSLRIQGQLLDFAHCIRTDASPEVTAEEARRAQETLHAAYLSARDGIKIPLPLRRLPDIDALLGE